MILGDIAKKARSLSHTDTDSYTESDLLIDINIWYQKVASMIFESQDETDFDDARIGSGGSAGATANYPIVTVPMVSGQRDYTVPVSENMLKIKRVDVTYDGTNWYRANPFDDGVVDWGMGNATNEDSNFIKQAPRYDIKYNSINVYPLANATDVTAGASIRVEWDRSVIPFTTSDRTIEIADSTAIPGFDVDMHPILAYGAALEKAKAVNLPNLSVLSQDVVDWEARLRTHYGRKQVDRQMTFNPMYTDNYGR